MEILSFSCLRNNVVKLRCYYLKVFVISARNAVDLAHKIHGPRPVKGDTPIIVLHGLLGRRCLWRDIANTMFKITKHTVLTVDLRNHGNSPYATTMKYENMVEDMIQLLDKLHIERAIFIGHNIGGRTAMHVSLTAPTKVAALEIIDSSPVSTPKEFFEAQTLIDSLKKVDFKDAKKISKARIMVEKQLREFVSDETVIKIIVASVGVKVDGKIGWLFNLDAISKNFSEFTWFPQKLRRKKYDGPCMFIGGQMSEYIPADDLIYIREIFPQAVISYIPGTGHHLYIEDPKSFLERTIAFIRFITE